MADNMVKLGTFGSIEEAFMVKNLLDEEGVEAFAVGETNGGLWQLNAVLGGASVFVPAEQIEHARQVLDHHEEHAEPPASTSISEQPTGKEVAAPETGITEDAPDPEPTEADFAAADVEDHEDDSPITESSPGEVMATRAFRSAMIGLLISSLNFVSMVLIFWMLFTIYSLYLLLQLARWNGDLGERGHRNMLFAVVINSISLMTFFALLWWWFGD